MDITELSNKIITIETAMTSVLERIKILENSLIGYATQGQLKISEAASKDLINSNSQMINAIDKQLLTISVPDETKYYLETSEIEDFRTNYKRLIAMMADTEALYQQIIAYVASINF